MSSNETKVTNYEDLVESVGVETLEKALRAYEHSKLYHAVRNARLKAERKEYLEMKASGRF